MPLEEIARLLDMRFFTPFRVSLTDGRHFDVVHPQQCVLMPRSVLIGLPGDLMSPLVAVDYVNVALIHITTLQPLSSLSSPGGNGTTAS